MISQIIHTLLFITSSVLACLSGSSGGCGGGCRVRAMAAGRLNADGNLPDNYVHGLGLWTDKEPLRNTSIEQLTNPNHLFHSCCEERGLPFACSRHCHFAAYNEEFLTGVTTGVDACPLRFLSEMQFCSAQGRDHSECCKRRGVASTLAGERCLLFCDQKPNKIVPLDYTYLPCFERFNIMKQCFYTNIQLEAREHFANVSQKLHLF